MIKNRPSIRAPKKVRGAKKMAESDKIPQIDPSEIEVLIQKIEQNKLDERERRLIASLLRTFLYIVAQLQEKKITLLKIKDMIFGRKSEKNKKEKAGKDGDQTSESGSGEGESGELILATCNVKRHITNCQTHATSPVFFRSPIWDRIEPRCTTEFKYDGASYGHGRAVACWFWHELTRRAFVLLQKYPSERVRVGL